MSARTLWPSPRAPINASSSAERAFHASTETATAIGVYFVANAARSAVTATARFEAIGSARDAVSPNAVLIAVQRAVEATRSTVRNVNDTLRARAR